MVINYPFYNISMPNVITRGKMIVEFAGELISTLSEFNKKVSFSSPQSKEKMWAEILKLMVQKKTCRIIH